MPTYTTLKPLYRHASDAQCCDCGRACAQMIISSLALGALPGTPPTQSVPVRQDQLKSREANNIDTSGTWYTFPDELRDLLNGDQRMKDLGYTDWRLVNVTTPDELFAHAAKSVQSGMPAVINIKAEDHWLCVRSVTYDSSGALTLLECLDPLLQATSNPPQYNQHCYVDACNIEAEWAVISQTPGELGAWEVTVGSASPTTYQNRCVGIVYGPTVAASKAAIKKKAIRYAIKKPWPPNPHDRARALLRDLATTAGLPGIDQILRDAGRIAPRLVRDLAGREKPYSIAAAYSPSLKRGLVALFDERVGRLFRVRLTSNRALINSILRVEPRASLWWQRRGASTLYSAYFPYRKVLVQGRTKYLRLIDEVEVVAHPSPIDGSRPD